MGSEGGGGGGNKLNSSREIEGQHLTGKRQERQKIVVRARIWTPRRLLQAAVVLVGSVK